MKNTTRMLGVIATIALLCGGTWAQERERAQGREQERAPAAREPAQATPERPAQERPAQERAQGQPAQRPGQEQPATRGGGEPPAAGRAGAATTPGPEVELLRRMLEEEAKHRERMARLQRLRDLAQASGDKLRVTQVADLEQRETVRHAEVVSRNEAAADVKLLPRLKKALAARTGNRGPTSVHPANAGERQRGRIKLDKDAAPTESAGERPKKERKNDGRQGQRAQGARDGAEGGQRAGGGGQGARAGQGGGQGRQGGARREGGGSGQAGGGSRDGGGREDGGRNGGRSDG